MINKSNYEPYLVEYLHGELNGTPRQEMEDLIAQDAEVAQEYELFKHTVLEADQSIVFDGKNTLYKTPQKAFSIRFQRYFAAASILLLATLGIIFYLQKKQTIPEQIALTPVQDTQINTNQINKIPSDSSPRLYKGNLAKTTSVATKIQPASAMPSKSAIASRPGTKPPVMPQQISIVEIQQQEEILTEPPAAIAMETLQEEHKQVEPTIEELLASATDTAANNNVSSEQAVQQGLVLNDKKNPRLFRAIHQLTRLSGFVRNTKNRLANTELIVKVGNREIINFY